jgi:hypothetical protein
MIMRSVRLPWRVIGSASFAAGLIAALSIPAGHSSARAELTSARAPSAAVPQCPASSLEVWLGLGSGGAAAGSTYYPLEFSNVSSAACTLHGYPGVSAIGSGGAQLGSAAGWNTAVTPSTVTLAPGATAHTVLQITDVGNYPPSTCNPATAIGLRVYPPNQTASTVVPYSFRACSSAGPVYLHVEAIQPGVGIPGQP